MRYFQFLRFAVALCLLSVSVHVLADEVLSPPGGKTWGDENATQNLLNMNRDPQIVRKLDEDHPPIVIQGTCTDTDGKTYQGDEEEYTSCMNRKLANNKASSAKKSETSVVPAASASAKPKGAMAPLIR